MLYEVITSEASTTSSSTTATIASSSRYSAPADSGISASTLPRKAAFIFFIGSIRLPSRNPGYSLTTGRNNFV